MAGVSKKSLTLTVLFTYYMKGLEEEKFYILMNLKMSTIGMHTIIIFMEIAVICKVKKLKGQQSNGDK